MHSPAGLLVTVGFLVGAVGSVPLALATFLLARRVQSFSRALSYAGVGVGFPALGELRHDVAGVIDLAEVIAHRQHADLRKTTYEYGETHGDLTYKA